MVEETAITTRITVEVDKSGLEGLPIDGIFEPVKQVIDDLSSKLDESAEKLALASASQLVEYERTYFGEHTHPFAKGIGANSFYAENISGLEYIVDNSAENNGFPYMVTDELGDNPGRKLEPHPFAEPGREALIDDLDSMWLEVSVL